MKVNQSFVIDQPREALWEFFEQVDEVARCVPGVESVEVVDADNSKVRVTQAVGPMTATFDLKMRITDREEGERIQFTAIGRAVKGAAGNVRTQNTVRLESAEEGTRVLLEADLAMGGVLGSVGQKVVAKQADQVTREFVASLERAIRGEPLVEEPAAAPAAGLPGAGALRPAAPGPLESPAVRAALAGALVAILALLFVRARRS